VGENDKRLCGRETVQNLNAFAGRRPERAAKIIGGHDRDATLKDGCLHGVRLRAGIARRRSGLGHELRALAASKQITLPMSVDAKDQTLMLD
jgi:hypothetical protein